MSGDGMRGWKIAGVAALVVIVLSIPLYVIRETRQDAGDTLPGVSTATFVGREQCIDCHSGAYEKWLGSDHDEAMAAANEQTVLGDFNDALFEHGGVTSRFYRKGDGYFVPIRL